MFRVIVKTVWTYGTFSPAEEKIEVLYCGTDGTEAQRIHAESSCKDYNERLQRRITQIEKVKPVSLPE